MESLRIWECIFAAALVSYLLRVLPLTLIHKPIENPFIRSLFYYLPYATLAVMTVPSIFTVSSRPLAGMGALVLGGLTAWISSNLFLSAAVCSGAVLFTELLF
ncbi:AzlD domain-containing protein [Dialister sp.]|uniref:AzlD domain-containing protein n=1 Tax=Dialister sp. TaxID=1955814 RepID=UPI002E814125|nr:AzlD domain-containing protein [Dialister sp.]MEE3452923.1 AzlD domain-containing protein [Dialister sp.]